MSDSTVIFRQACLAEVNDRIQNQVPVNRLTATDFVMENGGKLSVKIMSTVLTNLTPDVYMWTCKIWMTSFAASRKWSGNSEQVFISQLNFRPTSIGKHNSMGHLLPCAIDSKTYHPPMHLQWIGTLGMAIESCHVISMGPRQTDVPGQAIVCNDI